ncbi:MAG: DUF4402 domain-containing protein [Glaciecola sp.]|jgi:hypothetical protein|nr:DUF4402 domain-containing protein [Glaciecola sp.]MDG2099364.1 DUF4402 domain-containing protein [Glaciecola sp.]
MKCSIGVWILASLLPLQVCASDIEFIQDLDFGDIVVVDNSSPGTISLSYLGQLTVSSHFRIISPSQIGQVLLSNYPVNAELFVDAFVLQPNSSSAQVSPEQFQLTAISHPTSVRTRVDGTAIINLGGTIQTSGSGSLAYSDTDYSISIQIQVQY